MKDLSRTKAKLICFTGMDGSGKTTLAKFLVKEMKKRGLKCNYVYGRYKPILSSPALAVGKVLFLRGRDIKEYEDYSSAKRDAVGRYSLMASIYQKILLFDYSLQLIAKIILPKMLGRTVICDRYVYDTVINDIPRAGDDFDHLERLIKKCFQIAPDPDLIFLIDLPVETAYLRKDDTPSIEYLKERRNMYLDVGNEYGMVILDGSKSLYELKNMIQKRAFKEVEAK